MKRAILAAGAVLGLAIPGIPVNADGGIARAPVRATPIVAELLSKPELFVGRPIAIYGLVVESLDGGRSFLLQDVSQVPLLIVAPPGDRVEAGRQLMVNGVVKRSNGRLHVVGDELLVVRVVAGGGCC